MFKTFKSFTTQDTKKLELTKKALDDTKGKLARTEERVAELEKDQEKAQTELAEVCPFS